MIWSVGYEGTSVQSKLNNDDIQNVSSPMKGNGTAGGSERTGSPDSPSAGGISLKQTINFHGAG